MTRPKVLSSLGVVASNGHLGIAKSNDLLLPTRTGHNNKLLLTVTRLTFSDTAGFIDLHS